MPYVPLDPRGFRLTMGLRPLDEAAWLEYDDGVDDERALKANLLAEHYDDVVALEPAGDAGSVELLALVRAHVERYWPSPTRSDERDEHPLVAASRLVGEDFCVLVREDAWRLRAACVCFPSRWRLSSKIGTTLDDIHGPVPGYAAQLARPTNGLFDRLRPDRSFWRLNWTLLDDPTLHQPSSARRSPHGDLADWYFRVERQTLRALPMSGTVVFTIRTYVTSASTLAQRDGTFVESLLRSLDEAPPATQDYKGWIGVADRLRASLGL